MKVNITHDCNTPKIYLTPQDRAVSAECIWKCRTCKQKWFIMSWPNGSSEALRWGTPRYLKRRKEVL